MKRLALLITISSFCLNAVASGTRVGDGGHGVFCPGKSPVLLDLYETEAIYGRQLALGALIVEDERVVLEEYRSRVQEVMGTSHPSNVIFDQAAMLLNWMVTENGPLAITPDLGAFPNLEPGCTVKQIAVRGTDYLWGHLTVSRAYWDQASVRERVLLSIHEGAHSWFHYSEDDFMTGTQALRQFIGVLATSNVYAGSGRTIRILLNGGGPLAPAQLAPAALR